MSESIGGGGGDARGKVSALMARLREKKEAALPTRIPRVPRDGNALALSSGQQRLWFIEQLQPGNVAYNITGVVRLRGSLDIGALRSCFAEIVRRHEVLRTTFQLGESGPVQVVAPAEVLALPVLDLSGLPDVPEVTGEVTLRARENATQAFDLARGPLLRTTLIRLGAREHLLLLAMHHIVSDGWSLAVLLNEARALYEAFLTGQPSPLPELPIQYVDYAAWQRRWLESPASEQQLTYWRSQLAEAPDLLQLPADRPRPAVRTSRGGTHFFAVPAELRDVLLTQGREEGATPFVVLFAAYAALLYQLSGQTDLLIGAPVANRRRAETQGLIGFFVSTLVLRADLSGAVSFRELLRRLNGVVLEAFEHQDLPFDRLVSELQPQRLLSQTPLFQVAFALQNVPLPAWELAGLELSPVRVDTGTSMFDLTLYLKDSPERLEGWFEYAADLFDATTVARYAGNFETLLAGIAADGGRRLSEVGVLTAAESRQIAQWNSAPTYASGDLLHRRIEEQAARTPQRLAVDLDGQSLTYSELNARANRLARYLRRLGVGPNVPVGLCLERSPDLMVGLLGVLKAGGAYVPLDPAYPSERWGFMLRDARIAVLLSQESLLPRLPEPDWQVLCLDRDRELLAAGSGGDLPPAAGLDDLFYVIYTSGSTGRPKGAAVYQRSFLNLLDWYLTEFAVDADDSFLLVSSVSFDLTQKNLFAPLLTGGRLQLAPPGHYDPAVLIETIERERVTRINCTPSAFYPLVERDEDFPRLASMRSVFLGGEPISLARLERWRSSPYGRAEVVNTYGPTECTDVVSFHRLPALGQRAVVPVGRPVPGCQLWVLGPGLEPVPVGVAGQLCVGGGCVGAGYLRDAAMTAEKFLPDLFSGVPGARLYQTGDLARWLAGGEVEYLGRADHQVKVRGFRIELGEIESVLEGHPGVAEAVVLARPVSEGGGGNGDLRLVGYLVPDAERARPVRELLRLERQGRTAGHERIDLPNELTVFHQNRAETEFVYRELFEERSYFQHGITLENGACVFDAGANIGLFDVLLGREWTDLQIYAFEPLPPIFEVLRLNTEVHGVPVRLFQHGLASAPGTAQFDYFPHASILSGRFADAEAEHDTVKQFLLSQLAPGEEIPPDDVLEELLAVRLERQSFTCELKTLSQVIAETGVERIDLLKVDVEKAELDVLLGIAEEDWPRIRQVVAEVHDLDGHLRQITDLLTRHGFEVATEHDTALNGLAIYNLYAWRPRTALPRPASPAAPEWASPSRLLADVRTWVRERLPEYMAPAAWVLLDEMPLTPSGKVDRKALPAPEAGAEEAGRPAFVAPRTPTEEVLSVVWAELLRTERVGVTESFFELGGHSLLGTQMVSRVRDAFGLELPVRALFEAPTVKALAARIDAGRQEREGTPVPPLVVLERPSVLPLSFAQQRLWFLHQLEPGSAAYHIPAAIRLAGALDPAALAGALGEVVRRHETLRTTFSAGEDEAVQVVAPPEAGSFWPLPLIDLSGLPEENREPETLRIAAGEVARTFDLGRGPLLRSVLLRLGVREHALLLVMHHIVSDGWSMGVLVRDAVAAYRALARRPPSLPSLAPLPVQYGDFVLWQRSWLQGETLEGQLRFWRQHLAGAPAVLELPTDRPRTGPGRLGARVPLRLAPVETDRLKALARRELATLFMVLLEGYCALLQRYTGQSDVVVGTPIANRTRPEIEPLIGLFVNTLALRTRLDGGESPRALLRRIRSSALDAYAHQDVPFERLVEELAPERHLDHTPIFQVMLTLQNAPGGSTDLPGLRITPLEVGNAEAKFDWTLTVWEEDGGLQGTLGYKSELWDEPAVRRVTGHLERLLAGLAESPDGRFDELPLLGEAERRQLLDGGVENREWDGPASVHSLFETQAARVPDAPAVVFEDRRLSYSELNARANAVARRLMTLGVGPEVPVALCLERSLEVIVALLGVLKAGGAYLPLDPRLPRERVRQMLADARVSVAIAAEELRALLPESGLRILPVEEAGTGEGLENPGLAGAPEQLAYVLFTSGSTGMPHGVGVEHRQLLNYVKGVLERLDLETIESFATVSTLAADLGNTSLFPALLTGRCLHVISKERLGHPEAMAEYFDRHRVDVLKIVPSHLLALETPARPAGPLPRRFLILGGEASFRDHAERIRAAAPECVLLNHYGPTETTVGVLTHRWQPGEEGSGGALPLGRPLANSRVYVVDALGRLLPAGVPGELWIGGAGVSRGYLYRPDRTAERFLPDPWSGEPGARLYRTGDLVRRRPEGVIEFLGRIEHQVKIRGFRIELGEIEAALESHPAVRESVVLAREDRPGERRLATYVVGDEVSAGELRGWLGERLPDYMLPADFVFLDRLPLTPNGKVDRRALPAPAEALPALPAVPGAPAASLAEELLLDLFAEVLRTERVDPTGDFFALGGHSLLATQLMSRVRRAFGVEVPLRALFEEPTPAGLARRIDGIVRAREGRPAPPLRPVPREPGLPLSFAQQRLWFLYQMDPGSSSYNVPRAVRLAGELRPAALEAALSEVLRRHEVLHTSFPTVAGQPALEIRPPRPESLPRIDLSALPAALREAEAWRLAEEEARRPFDLAHGPLVRSALVRLDGSDHVLLFTLHHIVSDGWSTGVLVREAGALYQAFSVGAPSPLPELPIQYADFACWQRRWLSGEVLEEQLSYWRRQLAGLPDGLDLPLDRERPATPSLAGGLRTRVFPAELRLALHRLGRARGTTFFMTMLAVFAALLHRLSRQTDVVMGTPVANRNRVEIEGVIGFFVNTLVLRLDASQGPAFEDFLTQAREVALGASTHQDLPFERLVEDLAPERNLGRTPLFQVMFVVQNAPAEELRLPGLKWSLLPVETQTANFDLTLRLFETARGLEAGLEYKRALFDDETIDRLLGHLETLTGSAVSQPDAPITRLPILTAGEWHQLAREPLAAHRPFPADACLHRLFERQVARNPGNVAVVCGGERLTYAELNARADGLAARLRGLGVGPEVRVALWLDRSLDLVVAILGVLKAGGAYVPLDPSYPEERLRFILEDAGAPVLASVRGLLERLGPQSVETVLLDELGEEGAVSSPDLPDSTAYVIYTSGSMGTPKGVPVSHANVVRLFTATEEWFGFGERDIWTLFHSYAFDFSVWEMWGALLYGGRLVVVPYWISRSPEAFYSLLVEERVTVLNQTPSAFHQLSAAEEEPGRQGDLALRWVIFGGEALEPKRLRSWFDRHGDRQPTLVNMYGITETTVHVTFRALSEADRDRGSVIGVPIPDLYLQILDPEGEPVPLGVPGEIHVGGAGLARGYLGRPELTAQRFVPDPFGPWPGARLYASGDLARRRPDGELEYLGRADQQVKIRGFRIEPGEIEAALAQHPAVREVVVLARGSQGEKRLVAYLGTGGATAPGVEELRAFLRERLPEHMVPAVFVVLESLPLTAHGKIDRRALPEPDAVRSGLGAGYVAPHTPEEAILAEVWAEVLEVDRVGVHDNYFALGGDSIRSIRVLSLAEKRGLRLSLPQIFQHQTIAELVPHRLTEPASEGADAAPAGPFAGVTAEDRAVLPRDVEDAYPLSQLQLGMLFHSAYSPESLAYHNVTTFHLQGEIDPEALRQALAKLASRHPVLRTSFDLDGFSQPLQLVHREAEIPLGIEDLRGLSPEERKAAAQARFKEEKVRRFDWTQAPLVRFHLQILGEHEVQLTWAEHHAILDGWSVASMLADLFRLYRAELEGGASPAPPPAGVFRDFVVLEQRALTGTADWDYWSSHLADRTSLRLPRWPGAATAGGTRVRTVHHILPSTLVEALGELAASAEVPLKSVLLTAHLRTGGELLGSRDVLTGLISNGRPESANAEQALGLFLNTVPFRLRGLAGSWRDLAREAFRLERELMPHRRFPMAELQQRLGTGEPLFEVSFNYVHFHVLQGVEGLTLLDSEDLAETNFPLAVSFSRAIDGSRLRLALQYDTHELHPAQVEGFAELYLRALEAMAQEPDAPCRETPLLSTDQRHQLLAEWNDSAAPFPDRCLHELVEEQVDRTPDAVAVEAEEGTLTYRELDRWANRVAHRLRALGVGPEDRVGLCVDRSLGMIVGLLAVLKAGGAFIPLDPEYPRERLAFMIEDSGLRVLLSQPHLAGNLPQLGIPVLGLEDQEGRDDRLERHLGPDQAAYVIYTSGSTGRPKGVVVAHRGVVNRLAWAQRAYPVTAADRVLQKAAFSFDFSVWECFAPLMAGARVVLARPGGHKDPAYLVRTIRERGITLVHFVPSMLKAFLAEEGIEECRSLRYVFSGGETLPLDVQETFFARVPATLRNQYGPTEITIDVADWVCRPGAPPLGSVPIGRPLANGAMLILNDVLDPLPPGVAGDLYLGGSGVARGYRNRPDLTAERFIPHPFASCPGERIYRTGDRARHFPDGNVEFLGRLDDQVKVRGFRIEIGEIEAVLLAHPALRAAAVVARRDPGAQEARLVAYVVPRDVEAPAAGDLRGFLRQTLPDYMLPAVFVPLAELPLSVNGKLDRRALPAPEEAARKAGAAPVPPRDELEGQLVALWEEVLGTAPIGVQDDFHELGGHSLTAVRLMTRVEKVLGVRLPVSSVLEAATVERLASLLRKGQAPVRRPLVPLQPKGQGRPLFLVHPVGGNVFCYRDLARGLDRPVYGLQAVPDGEPASLESLASRYLKAVREIQPEGPYLLGGWSLGGTIAYEMARQLEHDGEWVALLAMIDVAAPEVSGEEPGDAALLVRLAEDLVRLSGQPVSLGPEVLESLDLEAGLDRLLTLGRAEGLLPPDVETAQLRELFEVFRRNLRAARGYAPEGYGGRVTFFRAEGSMPPGTVDPTFGWERLAATDLHRLDGDHYSLLRAPQAEALAAALERQIATQDQEIQTLLS